MRTKQAITQTLLIVFGIVIVVVSLFPLVWMMLGSLKTDTEVFAIPFHFFPEAPNLANYAKLLENFDFIRSILITFAGAALFTLGTLTVCSLAAYAFARIDFPGKKALWTYFIMTMFIPSIALLIPAYIIIVRLNMLNTLWALILPAMASAPTIFFIRQFYLNIPISLEEAAALDGCSRFKTFLHVFVPMSYPVFVIMGIGAFLGYWNAYVWPVLTISNPALYPVMQQLAFYRSDHIKQYGVILAGSTLSAVPTIVLFLIFQEHIIKGIKIAGLK